CLTTRNYPGYGTPLSNTYADTRSPYDPAVNHGWRKFMTLLRPPTNQIVYARLTADAQTMPGCAGHTDFDDVTLRQVESLPRVGGRADYATFVNYDSLGVDPYDWNKVYVGTVEQSSPDYQLAHTGRVWKSLLAGGVIHWNLVTRSTYKDNVQDGILSAPL